MFNYHSLIPWGSFRGRQEEKWGSFPGRFGDHFRVGDHFGVGIISGAVQVPMYCIPAVDELLPKLNKPKFFLCGCVQGVRFHFLSLNDHVYSNWSLPLIAYAVQGQFTTEEIPVYHQTPAPRTRLIM